MSIKKTTAIDWDLLTTYNESIWLDEHIAKECTKFLAKFKARSTAKDAEPVIICRADSKIRSPKMLPTEDLLWNSPIDKQDLYFYVNGGGSRVGDIVELRAFYIDLDAGKNSAGNYLPIKQVTVRKQKMRARIDEFPCKPSIIVETRNGYHLYWIFHHIRMDASGQERARVISNWERGQAAIFNFFADVGADTYSQRLNQLLRVGWTWWWKLWSKKTPWLVTAIYPRSGKYEFWSLVEKLTTIQAAPKAAPEKETWEKWEIAPSFSPPTPASKKSNVRGVVEFNSPTKVLAEMDANELAVDTVNFLADMAALLHGKCTFIANSAIKLAKQIALANGLTVPYIKK